MPHGAGRCFDSGLVARGVGTQGVLHAVAELGEHGIGDVQRVLRHKIDAHAFGTHQAHDEFNPLQQHFRCIGEEQMRLVEEKHQFRLIQVAHFGQSFKEFTQHPEQKRGVEARSGEQFVGCEDVDNAFAPTAGGGPFAGIGLHEIGDVEHGLAKELVAALRLGLQQAALNRAYAGGADVAVGGGVVAGVVANGLAHGAQVFHVQEQHALVVRDFEDQLQHASLRFVQIQHAAEQKRA